MPELPEVETVRRGLIPVLENHKITEYIQNRPDLRFPIPGDMRRALQDATVTALRRRGKYLILDIDSGYHVCWHLGMSGQMRIDRAAEKHDHIILKTDEGRSVSFNDPRRFGYVLTAKAGALDNMPHFQKMGPEPLDENHFHAAYLFEIFHSRKAPLKSALLDQHIVAGLGNIYVCEALYHAGLHPATAAGKLDEMQCRVLVDAVRRVISRAIEAGGSTLGDARYVQPSGELGYFQLEMAAYGRAGEKCGLNGCNGTIERIVQAGRSSFYCPVHQLPL